MSPAQATAYIINPLTGRDVRFARLFLTHPADSRPCCASARASRGGHAMSERTPCPPDKHASILPTADAANGPREAASLLALPGGRPPGGQARFETVERMCS